MRRLFALLQPVLIGVALIFIIALLAVQWDELRSYRWTLRPGWLLLSMLLLLASWAMEIGIWRHLLGVVDAQLPFWPAVRIWFQSAVVRYIPGNVWQPLSMTLQCQRWSIRAEATLTSVALYQAVILLAVAPIAALYVGVTGNVGLLSEFLADMTVWLVAAGLLPVTVFLARPGLLIGAINWALNKVGRTPLPTHLTSVRLLGLLAVAALNWLLWGGSFAALAYALGDYTPARMLALAPHLIAAYPIAYAIGFLSFITPSGFGVREGAFYVLLAPMLGGGVVTVIALAMRLWTTLGELLMAGAMTLLAPAAPAQETSATVLAPLPTDDPLR